MRGERLAPGFALGIMDRAEGKHLALRPAPVMETFVIDAPPGGGFLAIFFLRTCERRNRMTGEQTRRADEGKREGLHDKPF